jgi:hypothetical protein
MEDLMLESVPLSGYAICYGPLALTLLGFIIFAALTDAHARRTYLRRMDPRPDSERTGLEPVKRDKPLKSETPVGTKVVIDPTVEDDALFRYETRRRRVR